MSHQVRFYTTKSGKKVVEEFILRQDGPTIAKINRHIELLISRGPYLGLPYSRNLKQGLYELRIRGKNEVRIFYISMSSNGTIILLHAFNKRSQKIPVKELEIAKKRQKELT